MPGLGGPGRKAAGPSKSVASDFIHKTPAAKRKKFARAIAGKKIKSSPMVMKPSDKDMTMDDNDGDEGF